MGAFGISAVRTLACALAAVVALTACGSGTSKTAATNAMTDNEGVYLDTVKGRSGPGWSSWPSDAVLIEQGHQICERLRAGAMPRAVVFTSPAIFSSSLQDRPGTFAIAIRLAQLLDNPTAAVPQYASTARVLSDIIATLSKHSTHRTRLSAVRNMTDRD